MLDLSTRQLMYAGIVGNGNTCALVDARGRIGWLCVPTFAQFPVFASLLDPARGGCLELGVRVNGASFWSSNYGYFEQRYAHGTNILETTWTIAGCVITIRDAMPWGENVLVRDIAVTGRVAPIILVRLRLTSPTPPSTRFRLIEDGVAISETRCPAEGRLICRAQIGEQIAKRLDQYGLTLEFAPMQSRVQLTIGYQSTSEDERSPILKTFSGADEKWLASAVRLSLPDRALQDAFDRSLLVLRLLTHEPTGAILAAATASFPSEPGSWHNWDYRHCWVRDGCYSAQAFDLTGKHGEANRLYRFLLERQVDGQWTSPLWGIEPSYPTAEEEVVGLHGPGGETPIRIGNGAALQDQHDSPGNVLSGVYQHCLLTGTTDLAARHWSQLAQAVDWCCEHWSEPEAGIWERRDRNRYWVHGRTLCWVAVRDGIRLAKLLGKSVPPRWETAFDEIPRVLMETSWSEEKQAFQRVCGEISTGDISVLALLLEGMISPEDDRMRRTVEALARVLAYGAAFRRHEEDERHPFGLGTFWVIRALFAIGEHERAYTHLRGAVDGASNLGLFAEYFDPITSRQHGNFPQAYSHEALIKTIAAMLWKFDGERLVLFPAIPSSWIVTGNTIEAGNIPLGDERGTIALDVTDDALRFRTEGTGRCRVVVPPRYWSAARRVEI